MRGNSYWATRLEMSDDDTVKEIKDAVDNRLAGVEEEEPADGLIHISEIEDRIMEGYKDWGKKKGLLTGLSSLDNKIGGFGAGHVVLVGGETSQGKSALAANIVVNIAREKPVLLITLEMTHDEMGQRIAHINGGTLKDLDITFQEKHRLTYKDIKPLVSKAVAKSGTQLVVLDYLQYLGRGMTEKEVSIMSKEIKTLALEFNIPFLVIVSLRKGDAGKNKRKWTDIEIEDYMGAGAIGYDCDAAMVASRKDQFNEYDDEHMYVKILKTRNARLDYQDRYLKFRWFETRIAETWDMPPNEELKKQKDQEFEKAEVAQATLLEDVTDEIDLDSIPF